MMITNSKMIKAVVTLGNYIYAIGGFDTEVLKDMMSSMISGSLSQV